VETAVLPSTSVAKQQVAG